MLLGLGEVMIVLLAVAASVAAVVVVVYLLWLILLDVRARVATPPLSPHVRARH